MGRAGLEPPTSAVTGEVRRNSVVDARRARRPGITSTVSVGNDLKLEVAALARLLCGLVLYASIYTLLRLAINLAVLRSSSDAERDLEILPSATKSPFSVVRSSGRTCCRPTG